MDPLQQQAQLEASIKYAPQQRALQATLGQLAGSYGQQVASAQGSARMMQAAADAAMPQISNIYHNASESRKQALYDVEGKYNALGPAADIFRAALQREQLEAGSNLGQSRADALAELQRRKVEASEGAAFATSNASRQYLGQVQQILQQLVGLSGDQGSFAAATLQSLKNASAQRGVTLRGQDLSHQDRQAALALRSSSGGSSGGRGSSSSSSKPGKSQFSQARTSTAINQLQLASSWIGRLQGSGNPEGMVRQSLVQGARTKGGASIPRLPADIVEAAYEAKGWGVITPNTANQLAQRGINAGALGYRIGAPASVGGGLSLLGSTGRGGSGGALSALGGVF